jgi:hypothetical protein
MKLLLSLATLVLAVARIVHTISNSIYIRGTMTLFDADPS